MLEQTSAPSNCVEFRMARSREALADACRLILPMVNEVAAGGWHIDRILEHFETSRELMLIASANDEVIGGAFAFFKNGGVTVALLGVAEPYRKMGVGRRLLELIELQALRLGAGAISLGAVESARPFYARVGYSGKSAYQKQLPPAGRVLDAKLKRWTQLAGDLATGTSVCTEPLAGKLPSIFRL